MRHQQPALLLAFARIMRFQQRRKIAVPLRNEVQPALLHPALKISLRDFVWRMKDRVYWIENRNRRLFHRYSRPAQGCRIRRELARIEIARRRVVLHHQPSARLHKIEQALVVHNHIFLRVVSANPQHDRLIAA